LPSGFGRRARSILLPLAAALMLAACSTTSNSIDPLTTGSTGPAPTPAALDASGNSLSDWAARYDADEEDRTAALGYARTLQKEGRAEQAVAVLERAAIRYPEDREVLSAFGKALAANGELPRALAAIQRSQTPDKPDWRLLSAEAAILDQLGRNGEARRLYNRAITIAPNEPSVHSNLGMSYILTGEIAEAEQVLRKAVAMDGADSRVRQNLALAVGLAGRFDEAEEIAGAELPPAEAAANVAYLREMLGERDDWAKLAGDEA